MADALKDSDVTPDSSTGMGVDVDSPTTEKADANAGLSMLEHVRKTLNAPSASDDEPTKEEEPVEESSPKTGEKQKEKESSSEVELDPKEEAEEQPDKKDETEGKEDGVSQEKPVPYERFKEVNTKVQQLETTVKEHEPVVKAHNEIVSYCNERNVSREQFSEGLEIMGLINTDPVKALEKLNKIVGELQRFTGTTLPQDLQKRVDEGRLELADARELATSRAQAKFGERSLQNHQRMRQQEQMVNMQRATTSAVNSWAESKSSDPDFKPKKDLNGPDGKFERVADKFTALLHQTDAQGNLVNKPENPQAYVALLEKAYQAVQVTYKVTKPATRKPLLHGASSRGSAKTVEGAKTMKEAIAIALGR